MHAWDAHLASLIDHTLLSPTATADDVTRAADEAVRFGFAALVVQPVRVALAVDALRGRGVPVASVVAFPFGATSSLMKALEAERLVAQGAGEVDMVMNIGAFLEGRTSVVNDEVADVRRACGNAVLKLIIETACLDPSQIAEASRRGADAGADFIKTSTGYGPSGATVDAVRRIGEAVGGRAGVKAAGGIRDGAFARALIEAGATRLGCSASLRVIGAE